MIKLKKKGKHFPTPSKNMPDSFKGYAIDQDELEISHRGIENYSIITDDEFEVIKTIQFKIGVKDERAIEEISKNKSSSLILPLYLHMLWWSTVHKECGEDSLTMYQCMYGKTPYTELVCHAHQVVLNIGNDNKRFIFND